MTAGEVAIAAPPFRLFGPDHLLALGLILGSSAALVAARNHVPPHARHRLGQALAALVLAYIAASYYWIWRDGLLTWDYALPLHVCNVLILIVLYTLLKPNRLGSEIVYYWGLGGSVHALITPDLALGFPTWYFLQFFAGHGLLVVASAYLVGLMGLQPRHGSVKHAFLALVAYVVVVGALDAAFGWNYGYLCRKPGGASLLDYLGPWPWYVAAALGIALASFWALSLPWRLTSRSSWR